MSYELNNPKQSILDPFVSVFKGVGDLGKAFGTPSKGPKTKKQAKEDEYTIQLEIDKTLGYCRYPCWNHYKNFKKAFKFLSW